VHLTFMQCNPERLHPTNTAAHMIKNAFVRNVSKHAGDAAFPGVLKATANFMGPYDHDALVRRNPFNAKESMKRDEGLPLLPYSLRNVMLMPKGLGVRLDKGKWVLEPLLRQEVPADQDWLPTMWRFKVLENVDVDMMQPAAGGNVEVAVPYGGIEDGRFVGSYFTRLSTFGNQVFTFKWSGVAIRSLVFVYLYALSSQCIPGTSVPDSEVLAKGIERVRSWLHQANEEFENSSAGRAAAQSERERREAACHAPSMALVEKWLDSLGVVTVG
jgi:hypothetical protein